MNARGRESTDFYSVIADFYDEIFPFNEGTLRAVTASLPEGKTEAAVLDIGSATGSLANALARLGLRVTGIDADPRMIDLARSACAGPDAPVFSVGDMLNIQELFPGTTFHLILCFGNTLVHLPDGAAIRGFFDQARRLLTANGAFLYQILNYDRVLDRGIEELPVIETPHVVFRRRYLPRDDGRLEFAVTLSLKETGEVLRGTLPLYPLRKQELAALLTAAGFSRQEYWSDFRMAPYDPDGMILVGRART
ncbi:MAG TPA: class I SAM-dependent methyltransferase [Spirochaetia bacterium]|nr:class I SAM-dependent methyltransferase [Spirochaetia bacterium]